MSGSPRAHDASERKAVQHNPRDIAIIVALAGACLYFVFSRFAPEFLSGVPAFASMAVLVGVVAWLLGALNRHEMLADDLRRQIASVASESRSRDRSPNQAEQSRPD